jgi:hypothetical protein
VAATTASTAATTTASTSTSTSATAAAVTAATETASTMTATETAARSAGEASAIHTATEAGLAAEGVLVCHAAVVESAECAGVTAPLLVRRDESAIGSMVKTSKIILMTSKTSAVYKTVTP